MLTATGIGLCQWLNLEDGVLVKYSETATQTVGLGGYVWQRVDPAIPITYSIFRFAKAVPNSWRVVIAQGTCFAIANFDQDPEQDIPVDFSFDPVPFFGVCDVEPPIETLRVQSYGTIDDALVDYPSLQNWDWPAY